MTTNSLTYDVESHQIIVKHTDGTQHTYTNRAEYLAEFPDREADCYVFDPRPPRFATVEEARLGRRAECDALAAQKRNAVVAGISPVEMSSWPIKRAEAIAWSADNAAPTPLLSAESAARGMALADLVAKVLANSANLIALEAVIAGNCGKHCDALDALAANGTVADVDAYDISTGWPE